MENIKACIRIKPLLSEENEEIICDKFEENSVRNLKTNERFEFEHVFDAQTSTLQIFTKIGLPLVNACFEGINVCVFAYGQTSSGKTYTMKGNSQSPGFIPQALDEIFQKVEENANNNDFEIKCSYMEIYNEHVNDLLNPNNQNLEVRENLTKGIHIPGLTDTMVQDHKEAFQLFEMGELARKVGETSLNEQSSRSHTIFRVSMEMRNKTIADKITYSTLNLVDLAGSEGVSRTKTEGIRKREGANINKSLLALSNVISKLGSKENSFISFRDSKLTRILQPCLGGNSRTVVICAINPLLPNYQETLNTLKFAISAGAIRNQIKINEKSISSDRSMPINKDQLKEYNDLKSEVNKSKEFYEAMNRTHNSQVEALQQKLASSLEENQKLNNSLNSVQSQVEHYAKLQTGYERDLPKLKSDNKALLDLLTEIETKTKKHIEEKTTDFHAAYTALDRKLRELEQENTLLKTENKKLALQSEKQNHVQTDVSDDKRRLIDYYKEQIENLKKTIDSLTSELRKKISIEKIQDGVQINHFNTQNFINMTPQSMESTSASAPESINNSNVKMPPSSRASRRRKLSEDGYEMKLLDLETSLKGQLMNKNKELAEMSTKLREAQVEICKREEKIFELENQLIKHKSSTPSKQEPEECEYSVYNDISKKKKTDNFGYVKKRVMNSPSKEELKKEIKYLETKNKNYEKKLGRNKTAEERYCRKLDELTRFNLELENKLNSNLSMFDSDF